MHKMSDKKCQRTRVCVIGAGAAGLCAARHLSQYESLFVFDVYEKTCKVGGVWNYTDSVGFDDNGLPIHTSMYKHMRVADEFKDQTVLVLGGGPSGIDISIEVSQVAKQVVFCHRNSKPFVNLPQNIKQELNEIQSITETGVELKGGTHLEMDSIVLATGYHFDFSFLDKSCAINVNSNGRVEGIYLHLINQTYPSMAIWAIAMKVIPFPLYHQQVLLFMKSLTGELVLPSIEEMERDTQQDMSLRKSMGLSERHFHKMVANLFIDYSDKLATIANIKPFTPVFRQLHKDLEVFRNQDLVRPDGPYKRLIHRVTTLL
ncbi:unnamed protein product [Oppiella nova]|uniref:Flavin-containing monooxygenase n=1 Tax=Oppiella nova TaxID=334625 RepID=A0A7R9LPB3_9ACAR|nr:unnamed protein product [Oppiella nova]CAG2165633.1 unnamed protein product [Oppiella nova]